MLTESKVWKDEIVDDIVDIRMTPASNTDRDPLNLKIEDDKTIRGETKLVQNYHPILLFNSNLNSSF